MKHITCLVLWHLVESFSNGLEQGASSRASRYSLKLSKPDTTHRIIKVRNEKGKLEAILGRKAMYLKQVDRLPEIMEPAFLSRFFYFYKEGLLKKKNKLRGEFHCTTIKQVY